ncbi:MAG: tetratricopeptide repeat protein [Acidobacteriota bacterium]|nr:tetratricopeptide repeat protein [Acidobacteriota bacterium]
MLPGLVLGFLLAAVPQSLLDSGRRAFETGDLVRAEHDFRQYLAQYPNSAEALSNLGAICARREQYPDAVRYYEKALRADPKLVPVHFNLAVALGHLNQYAPAADHLRAFLKSYPQEPRAHQLLGLCLTETGDFRGALPELDASYQLNPKDSSIVYSLAYANARAGDIDRAASLLRDSAADPAQSKLIEGLIEYRRGRFPEAKAIFQSLLALQPDSVPALTALGRLQLLDHNDADAIRLLEHATRLNPSDAESTYQLGVLYDRNGRSAEGIALLKRAVTLRANYADPHYQLGRMALDRKDYPAALAELELARKLLPDQEAIRMALGRTYQALGRAADARAEFTEVRRLKAAVIERDRQRVESDALMKP